MRVNYYVIKRDLEDIEKLVKSLQNKQFEDVALDVENLLTDVGDIEYSYEYYDYTDVEKRYTTAIYEIFEDIINLKVLDKYFS